jgi:hypothetical protein
MVNRRMPLTGISNHGLAVIAILVAILWGCILTERVIRRRAREETRILLRMQSSRSVPSRAPAPSTKRLPRSPMAAASAVQVDFKV